MAWAKNGTPNTLSGTGDTMTISDLTANKFNQFLVHSVGTGQTFYGITFNNNTNSVYAERRSPDGGSDLTSTSQTKVGLTPTIDDDDSFTTVYCISISGEEKLLISNSIFNGQNGATNAPERREVVGKFVPSPDADITRVDITNGGSGDFLTDSNLSAIGTD